jgi:serine/threonine protein kinase
MGTPNANAAEAHDQADEITDELEKGTPLLDGQFTIESFLNAGGFGITYLARDSLDRTVVVKECFPSTLCRRKNQSVQPRSRANLKDLRTVIERFALEARSLAKVSHPNIVAVHQVFEDNDTAYMAMDFVRGRDLLEIISSDEEGLSPAQVRMILEKLLGAIGHVHSNDMLHRDISPDNILIRDDGEPVLIDFGAAKEQVTDPKKPLSALRVVKEGYSPQEFYIAGSEQNPSCDLYSLAASFYHIITGSPPPDSQKRLAAIAVDDDDPYVPCTTLNTGYDDAFCSAIDKAMSVMARDRIQSAEEWLELIAEEEVVEEQPAAVPVLDDADKIEPRRPTVILDAKADRPGRPPSQTSMMPLIVGTTALVAMVGAGFYFMGGNVSSDPSPTAQITGSSRAPTATEETVSEAAPQVEAIAPVVESPAPTEAQTPATKGVAALPTEIDRVAPAQPAETTTPGAAPEAGAGLQVVARETPATTVTQELTLTEAPVAAPQLIGVLQDRTLDLPFTINSNNPNIIGSVAEDAPFWMVPGLRIVSVNGTPITSLEDMGALVGSTAQDGKLSLNLNVATSSNEIVERQLTLGYKTETTLENGLAFETRLLGGEWVTRITGVPNANSEVETGDVLVASLGPERVIEDANSLGTLLSEQIVEGKSALSVAVNRDGQMWVKTVSLPTK